MQLGSVLKHLQTSRSKLQLDAKQPRQLLLRLLYLTQPFLQVEQTDTSFSPQRTQSLRVPISSHRVPIYTHTWQVDNSLKRAHAGEVHKFQLDSQGKRIRMKEYISPKGRSVNPHIIMVDTNVSLALLVVCVVLIVQG